jgi:hypothetical protein
MVGGSERVGLARMCGPDARRPSGRRIGARASRPQVRPGRPRSQQTEPPPSFARRRQDRTPMNSEDGKEGPFRRRGEDGIEVVPARLLGRRGWTVCRHGTGARARPFNAGDSRSAGGDGDGASGRRCRPANPTRPGAGPPAKEGVGLLVVRERDGMRQSEIGLHVYLRLLPAVLRRTVSPAAADGCGSWGPRARGVRLPLTGCLE